jgi:hypothetical protein
MSTIVKITKLHLNKAAESSTLNSMGMGIALVSQGIKELNYAYEKEKELVDCDNNICKVDLLIKTLEGKEIGVIEDEEGIDFVVKDLNCTVTQAAIKKIRQRYSKYLMLHELKSKGYNKVKEEKLPNGSIRMVVEKWD